MSDDEVYQQCAADAVEHMLGGKVASLFMFLCFGVFFFGKVFIFLFQKVSVWKKRMLSPFFFGGKEHYGKIQRSLIFEYIICEYMNV